MFDTYRIEREPRSVTVTEKRAPTDESVRILREVEREAWGRVIASYPVQDNALQGRVVHAHDGDSALDLYVFIFSLNGHRYEITERVDPREAETAEPDAMIQRLYRVVAERIAADLLRARAGREG